MLNSGDDIWTGYRGQPVNMFVVLVRNASPHCRLAAANDFALGHFSGFIQRRQAVLHGFRICGICLKAANYPAI